MNGIGLPRNNKSGTNQRSRPKSGRLAVFVLVGILTASWPAFGQSALVPLPAPGQPYQSRLTLQNEGVNGGLTIHRDPLGRPCLQFEAASRAEVVNPKIFDHIVSVYNRCLMRIKLRVCYYHSTHCVDLDVPGKQRKDAVLGIFPNMQYFRYSYSEKF